MNLHLQSTQETIANPILLFSIKRFVKTFKNLNLLKSKSEAILRNKNLKVPLLALITFLLILKQKTNL